MKIKLSEANIKLLFEISQRDLLSDINDRKNNPQTTFDWIADYFMSGGRIKPNSFIANLDKNYFIEKLNFISNNGHNVDEVAEQISNDSNLNIEPSDIIMFISMYKSVSDYWESTKKDVINSYNSYYGQQ